MDNSSKNYLITLSVIFLLAFIVNNPVLISGLNTYNVVTLGARPDGVTDTSKVFINAWNQACNTIGPSTILVPKGRYLIRYPIKFDGSNCKSVDINFNIMGTLIAPTDYRVLGNSDIWLSFESVTGVSITGGTLDGKGAGLWNCKLSNMGNCPRGATTMAFTNSNNVQIKGLKSINSQLYHIVFNGCNNVKVESASILASGNSPNTDGFHVQYSNNVAIINSNISTGDDCVSVGPATVGLLIQDVLCGPGHGISIGSLGKDLNEPGVQNVTVKDVTFTNTQNGLRIKSWGRPSNGFVKDVTFQHCNMVNVQNPIIIDQNYCPHNLGCPGKASGVQISDVIYQDIHGTSSTEVAVKFDCSPINPCENLKLEDVKLTYNNEEAMSLCVHAVGSSNGTVVPQSCL
ncbi:hypothetical protein RND81_12G080700 [Saponaria officinalis]|uniref:Polygalacturonase n=1 Tax=Saponaria officinalis TaxID=3572 RepID=A0AAW1H7Y5_SAPOF